MALKHILDAIAAEGDTVCAKIEAQAKRQIAGILAEAETQAARLCEREVQQAEQIGQAERARLIYQAHLEAGRRRSAAWETAYQTALAAARGEFRQALAEAEAADGDLPREAEAGEEARFMKTSEGLAPAYNAQIAVDADRQIIVAQQVRTEGTDRGLLGEMLTQVAENCAGPPHRVSADGGYFTEADVVQLEAGPSELHLPPKVSGAGEASKYEWVAEAGAYRCLRGDWLRPYRVRRGHQIYRTAQCQGCAQAGTCGVTGRSKKVHVPLAEKGYTDSAFDRLHARVCGFLKTSLRTRGGPYRSAAEEDLRLMREWLEANWPEFLDL